MTEYEQVMKALQASFPEGTVIVKGSRAFIPVQVYMLRLEEVAKEHWKWRLIDQPFIDLNSKIVTIKGELQIMEATRQGIGIGVIQDIEPQAIKTAILTAETEALRDSCDKYLMGWKDLAPHREWANNPGVVPFTYTLENTIPNFNPSVHSMPPPTNRICIRCRKPLVSEDTLFLSVNNIRNDYCREHVPKQLIKNL